METNDNGRALAGGTAVRSRRNRRRTATGGTYARTGEGPSNAEPGGSTMLNRTPRDAPAQTLANRLRLREIERVAKDMQAADSNDFPTFLTAAARHLDHVHDPRFGLECWARR